MPFRGFEGAAGTGKTYRLINTVAEHLAASPLQPHQRVLALTFMHGSRRRLEERFRTVPALRDCAMCMTIDSLANAVWQRWRSLAAKLGARIGDFDQTCDACGQLLERPEVAAWVAQSSPVVVVDEAQELKAERLRILKALVGHVSLFVAADEFQCLDDTLDTRPFMDWFQTGRITPLTVVHRTNQQGLLNAGVALRALQTPQAGQGLTISYEFRNVMPFKIAAALHRARGTRALIYASGGRAWTEELIGRLAQGMASPAFGNIPPLRLVQEQRPQDDVARTCAVFGEQGPIGVERAVASLGQIADPPGWLPLVQSALLKEHRCQGKADWQQAELISLIERKAAQHRAYGYERVSGIPVMSIHQAKNRQFENVVLLWPPGVPGDGAQKARLLYNGITRAQQNCRVFVRTQDLLAQAPFRFP